MTDEYFGGDLTLNIFPALMFIVKEKIWIVRLSPTLVISDYSFRNAIFIIRKQFSQLQRETEN